MAGLFTTLQQRGLKKVPLVMGQPGTESEVDGIPRFRTLRVSGPSLDRVSILFLPRRPDLSATSISLPGRYARFLKWTRTSVAACRSRPTAAGSSIHKLGDVNGDIMLVDHFH